MEFDQSARRATGYVWRAKSVADLANYLWRVDAKTYPYVQNNSGQDIKVTDQEYVNRLWAYLHQRGVVGRAGKYLRAEFQRIHALDDLTSKAHKGIHQDELRLAVITLYTVLGEMSFRTKLEPITEIKPIKENEDA